MNKQKREKRLFSHRVSVVLLPSGLAVCLIALVSSGFLGKLEREATRKVPQREPGTIL